MTQYWLNKWDNFGTGLNVHPNSERQESVWEIGKFLQFGLVLQMAQK